MISVTEYRPTCDWHEEDRHKVACEITHKVKERYGRKDNQPLTGLEVMDVAERLTALVGESSRTLETNRERILNGIA